MNTKDVSYLGEVWKDIKDYEDEYEVSNLGRVRNKKTKRILKLQKHKGGYLFVILSKNGKIKGYCVHRLVYEAFIGEIPKGMQVNHKDENKQNNILSNIDTLMTPKENNNYGTHNERVSKTKRVKCAEKVQNILQKSLDGKVIRIWCSMREIERELGFPHVSISQCCRGGYFDKRYNKWINITQSHGFIWEYEKATA